MLRGGKCPAFVANKTSHSVVDAGQWTIIHYLISALGGPTGGDAKLHNITVTGTSKEGRKANATEPIRASRHNAQTAQLRSAFVTACETKSSPSPDLRVRPRTPLHRGERSRPVAPQRQSLAPSRYETSTRHPNPVSRCKASQAATRPAMPCPGTGGSYCIGIRPGQTRYPHRIRT